MNMAEYLYSYLESRKQADAPDEYVLPTLDDLQSAYISYLLELTFHNISQVAKILKVSRTTLYNKLSKSVRRPA